MKNTKDISEFKMLTIEELKSFDGLADISMEETEHIIETLKELSLLTYNILADGKTTLQDYKFPIR